MRLSFEQLESRLCLSPLYNPKLYHHPKPKMPAPPPVTVTVPPGTTAVTVTPVIAIAKPVGYQTFHRTALQDNQLHSKQEYCRYLWADIEKSAGVYDFTVIDRDYQAAKAAGQQFNFRVMPFSDGGGGIAFYPGATFHFNGATTHQPDLNNSAVQTGLDKLLAALGSRYGANTATVDIGWWGPYGEWSNYNEDVPPVRPTLATMKWLIAEHQKYFPTSFVIIQEGLATDDMPSFQAGLEAGCGVRYDSWHSKNTWQEGEHAASVNAITAAQQWNKAPIILEPWDTNVWSTTDWQQACSWAQNTVHAWAWSTKANVIPMAAMPYVNQLLAFEAGL